MGRRIREMRVAFTLVAVSLVVVCCTNTDGMGTAPATAAGVSSQKRVAFMSEGSFRIAVVPASREEQEEELDQVQEFGEGAAPAAATKTAAAAKAAAPAKAATKPAAAKKAAAKQKAPYMDALVKAGTEIANVHVSDLRFGKDGCKPTVDSKAIKTSCEIGGALAFDYTPKALDIPGSLPAVAVLMKGLTYQFSVKRESTCEHAKLRCKVKSMVTGFTQAAANEGVMSAAILKKKPKAIAGEIKEAKTKVLGLLNHQVKMVAEKFALSLLG